MKFNIGKLCVLIFTMGLLGSLCALELKSLKPNSPEFKDIKILNNLCWELLNVKSEPSEPIKEKYSFTLPLDRFIFIRSTADSKNSQPCQITIDSEAKATAVISHSGEKKPIQEAMRYLKAGKHTISISPDGKALKQIIVRAIPQLQLAAYGYNPVIEPFGPYDWDFLEKKDILPNINAMISSKYQWSGSTFPHCVEWKEMGKWWIWNTTISWNLTVTGEDAVESIYKVWTENRAMNDPNIYGMIMDEFGARYEEEEPDNFNYSWYQKAVERLYENPKFQGKKFSPYVTGTNWSGRGLEFIKTCIEKGGFICDEKYYEEVPTLEEAQKVMKDNLVKDFQIWEKKIPGCMPQVVIVLSIHCQPYYSLNINPAVNFKVLKELQYQTLATDPTFFGLGGIQEYNTGYADEENLRWSAKLFRHYAIEGNTEKLSKESYNNLHIGNPDFADGTERWTVSPAEEGSIKAKTLKGYGALQSRVSKTIGDSFLWMKRSAKKPNSFSQEIKNLEPGKLYSMKMITADYSNIEKGLSVKKSDVVTIKIDNAEMLTGPKQSFQFTFPHGKTKIMEKFSKESPFYMNYHWRVFRAKGSNAKLTVSDWADDKTSGDTIGQEIIYNFIEIQPYLED